MNKKIIILILVAIIIIAGGIYVYWYFIKNNGQSAICLNDNEVANYTIKEEKNAPSSAEIIIKDKNTSKEISEFQISNILPNHYYGYEIHKCGVYVVREFNYDYVNGKTLTNFRMEVWKYNYNGIGQKLVEENDFRVDPNEKYLALVKSYLGQDDYSLVIKDLHGLNNIFTLKLNDILKQYSDITGSFGLLKWSDDSRYFWADIFDTAYEKGFVRIDSQNWSYKIYKMPTDIDIGISGPLNFNTGYITLHPGVVWTGMEEMDNQIKDEWRKEEHLSEMYLYNIFTKNKILIVTTSEPLWSFNPKWLSDTKLQYEMPNGEKRVYEIK